MGSVIQVRRDTATNWTSTNPILADGEYGYEKDTGKLKIGNGTNNWTTLAYQIGTPVPENAVFTDTMYDDTSIQATVANKQDKLAEGAFVDGDKTKLDNQSGINTGDQTKTQIDALGIDAATVTGKTVETNVPVGAVFTDTQVTVEDVLTSTSTINALSANMGKQLQDTKIASTNYATSTTGGTVKVRIDGSTLYLTTNGTDA